MWCFWCVLADRLVLFLFVYLYWFIYNPSMVSEVSLWHLVLDGKSSGKDTVSFDFYVPLSIWAASPVHSRLVSGCPTDSVLVTVRVFHCVSSSPYVSSLSGVSLGLLVFAHFAACSPPCLHINHSPCPPLSFCCVSLALSVSPSLCCVCAWSLYA